MRLFSTLVLGLVAALAATSLMSADNEPHMKTKLCNPAETSCTFVTNNSAHVNLRDAAGVETGTVSNPLTTTVTLSFAPELLNGRLFGAAALLNAATGGGDNPLVLIRNPLSSGKNYFIFKTICGVNVTNVLSTFKVFGSPVFNNTVANISTINQPGLDTTVTVTTATNHNATVGATATIAGTVNFNGSWTVTGVTSPTIYTFTKTPAPLITVNETVGTSTVPSSLGTTLNAYSFKRVASPMTATALVTTLPTTSSNGQQLIAMAQGQNSTQTTLIDQAQISLEPGENLLITGAPSSNNREVSVSLIWSEVDQ